MSSPKQSLNICLVSYMLSKRATGLSSYIIHLVARLLDAGHHVTVLGTDLGYRGSKADEMVELDERARTLIFDVPSKIDRKLYRSRELVAWLASHAQEFDLVDIQGVWALVNIDVARVARKAGVPYIVTPHGMMTKWDWSKRKQFKRALFRLGAAKMLNRAWRVRYLSAGELENSYKRVKTPPVVIPNAVSSFEGNVEPSVKEDVRSKRGIPPEHKLVLFLGRISYQKGVLELLQAFDLLYQIRKDVTLLIIGPSEEGKYADSVREFIAHCAARSNIRLEDPIFGDDKFELYRAADVFTTLSRNEGLSLAALEALAEGLPVVLTPDSNLPQVEGYYAGAITTRDPQAASSTFIKILEDNGLLDLMKTNAKHMHRNLFSWPVVLPQVIELYQSAAAKSGSSRQ